MEFSSENMILVSSIQQFINKISFDNTETHENSFQQSSVRQTTKSRPITKTVISKTSQNNENLQLSNSNDGYYNMWNDYLGCSYQQENISFSSSRSSSISESISEYSTLSISPTPSVDSLASSSNDEFTGFKPKRKLELPSKKASLDLNKLKTTNRNLSCSFCKNNNEPFNVYTSHSLKDSNGRITCPLLKIYKCPICGESGQNAHTITYCKKFKAQKRDEILQN